MLDQSIDLPSDLVPWLYAVDGPAPTANEQSISLDVYGILTYFVRGSSYH